MLFRNFCHIAGILFAGIGIFLQEGNHAVRIIESEPHHILIFPVSIPQFIQLFHDCLVRFRFGEIDHELCGIIWEAAP